MDLNLSGLKPACGAKKRKKIVGRGRGSGHGGSSTRGMKGQLSRSGGGPRFGFEGGQTPLVRRMPKRGFTNPLRKEYVIINLKTLESKFSAGALITLEILQAENMVKKKLPLKILGQGNLSKPLKIKANQFSSSAKEKILAAGGSIEQC